MEFKIISQDDLGKVINQIPHGISRGVLFSGDRYSCIDEAIALLDGETLVALATIAPVGEQNSGIPTIVGIWVKPEFRHQGHGSAITQKVIERGMERRFEKIQLDALCVPILKIYEHLPEELHQRVIFKNFIIPGVPAFFD